MLTCLPITGSLSSIFLILWNTAVANGQPLISAQVLYMKFNSTILSSYISWSDLVRPSTSITSPLEAGL